MESEFGVQQILNRRLKIEHIPLRRARWENVAQFALTFDGYKRWGGFGKCAAVANARRSSTLDELRTCLFFEQRRWRCFGETRIVRQ